MSKHPPLAPGWQTGGMRRKAIGGDSTAHDENIRALGEALVEDIAQQHTGGDREEAAALVEAHLVGMRQPAHGRAAMAASPEAQRLLDDPEGKWAKRLRGKRGAATLDV